MYADTNITRINSYHVNYAENWCVLSFGDYPKICNMFAGI